MALARVKRLFVTRRRGAVVKSVDSVEVTTKGLKGDYHSGIKSNRQILMQSQSVLNELDLKPGELFENILFEAIDVMNLPGGLRFKVGNAVLEVTMSCEPCVKMESIRHGLKEASLGKRGKFARVIRPGTVSVDDTVTLL